MRKSTVVVFASLLFVSSAHAGFIGKRAVSGFFSTDNSTYHAMVAQISGVTTNVIDVAYQLSGSFNQIPITSRFTFRDKINAVSGFFTPHDNMRHAILGWSDGSVEEIFYDAHNNQGDVVIAPTNKFSGITAISGWNDGLNHYHVAVGLSNGEIWELEYGPLVASPAWTKRRSNLNNNSGIVDLGGYANGNLNRIIFHTANDQAPGDLNALAWPSGSFGTALYIIPMPGIVSPCTPPGTATSESASIISFTNNTFTSEEAAVWSNGPNVCVGEYSSDSSGFFNATYFGDYAQPATVVSVGPYSDPNARLHVIIGMSNGQLVDDYMGGQVFLGTF